MLWVRVCQGLRYFDLVPDGDPSEVPAAPVADEDDADTDFLAGICGPSVATSSSASRPSGVAAAHVREVLLTDDGIDEGLLSALDEALRPDLGEDADLFCMPCDELFRGADDAAELFGDFSSSDEDVRDDASGGAGAAGGGGDGAAVLGERRDPSSISIARFPDHTVWEMNGDEKVQYLGTARYVGVSTNAKMECVLHQARAARSHKHAHACIVCIKYVIRNARSRVA